jgi:hypothetical protein
MGRREEKRKGTMKKIHLELDLTEEELDAFRKVIRTTLINTDQVDSDLINRVSLNRIWGQIHEQVKEVPKYLTVDPDLTLQAYMTRLRNVHGFETMGNFVVYADDNRLKNVQEEIISEERVFGWSHNPRTPGKLLVKHFSITDRYCLKRLKRLDCLRCVWVECDQEYESMKKHNDYLLSLVDQTDIVEDYCPVCFGSKQQTIGVGRWGPCPVCCNTRD